MTNEIFEIKPNNLNGINAGRSEVQEYVTKANLYCAIYNMNVNTMWVKGTNYTTRYLTYPKDPNLSIVSRIEESGVITYDYTSRSPQTQPIVIPQNIADKLKNFLQNASNNFKNIAPEQILAFLKSNPDLVIYIKSAAIGAAVSIIVGTIVEDILSASIGVSDDIPSFLFAYKIVRIAWKL